MVLFYWIILLGFSLASIIMEEPATAAHIYIAASFVVGAIFHSGGLNENIININNHNRPSGLCHDQNNHHRDG